MPNSTISPSGKRLVEAIQNAFPVDDYAGAFPKEQAPGVVEWRSKMARIDLPQALDIFGDVLIDLIIGYEISDDQRFDDFMLLYFLDQNRTKGMATAEEEFSVLNGRQRKVVFEWLGYLKLFPVAQEHAEAYASALAFWAAFSKSSAG